MTTSVSIRHVRLFKNGRSQAVRIPREFELPGNEAILSRDEHGRLILEPAPSTRLVDLLSSWKTLGEEDAMPPIHDLPPDPVDL